MFTFSYKWHIWIIISCRLIYTCTFLARFMKRWFYCCLLLGGRSLLWRSGLFVPLCFGEGGGKEMKLTWVKLRNGSSFWGDEKGNENGRNGWDIKGEQYTYVYICLSFYWCLSVFPSVDLSNSLFILRAIHISIYMSVHIHTQYIYAYVYVFLRVCAH